MGKTIREFATEFSTDIKQVQNKVTYIRRNNKQFGKLNKSGVREFSPTEIQYLKEVLNLAEKPTELSAEFSNEFYFIKVQLEEKDKQISKLQQALDQQQILTKQAQDQSQNLLLENNEIKEKLAEENSTNWFQKLFRK
ncbi:hypothetical protein ACQUD3_12675 [Lactococcus lactis]|uniref:hypothetical protein n=1 Tax=Lactococcus lactis TaxID=1358 RepID=UPI0028920032|nr:hypothetical protein [Lactococcus lactis]MDT2877073.1 hypothetical protein [Lactococcus lactis]MDT2893377.1 hypothetical protein [Lactococcus lactis]MDT2944300.1 hypothetical protein [Lactococcus lactis]MDT2971506.1 hypothetical protein [Lactococcus lactis]